MTKFMQGGGVFELFKAVGSEYDEQWEVTIKEENNFKESMMLLLLAAMSESNNVIFAHVRSIASGDKKILNTKYPPYTKKGISVVSNGTSWFLLKDFTEHVLKNTEFKINYNEHVQVDQDNKYLRRVAKNFLS